MIRSLRPSEALVLGLVRSRSVGPELTAAPWPKTPPEEKEPGVLELFRYGLLPSPQRRLLGVSMSQEKGGRINGFVDARGRAGGLVWDVEYLRANDVDTGVAVVRWVTDRAVSVGARRVFIETPSEGEGADVARRASFERYSEG